MMKYLYLCAHPYKFDINMECMNDNPCIHMKIESIEY
jgi:hypothetical protein